MIPLLLDATIQVSLVVLMALAVTLALRNRSAAVRHWVLAVAFGCAAAMPLLERFAPAWEIPAPAQTLGRQGAPAAAADTNSVGRATEPLRGVPAPPAVAERPTRVTVIQWVAAVWIAGAAASLLILAIGLARLAWLAAHATRVTGEWAARTATLAREYGLHRPIALLQSDHPTLLVTWGVMRPKILLPAAASSWNADRMNIILRHELAHVRRGDWASQMAAEVVRSIHWFNPLAWIACTRMRDESERACDDDVLSRGVDGSDYASHLLDLARTLRPLRFAWSPAPGIVRPSRLERRITAMLNTRADRQPMSAAARIATAAGAVVLTLLIAGFAAFAQGAGSVSGGITDPSGRPVPEANVSITNVETGATYAIPADQAGAYRFSDIPAGTYRLEIRAMGFAIHRAEIKVTAGRAAPLNVSLSIGTVQETITVRGGAESGRRLPPPPPPPPPAPDERAARPSQPRKSTGMNSITPPTKVRDVRPRYADHLWQGGIEGTVLLDARIDSTGATQVVHVVSSPHPELTTAATEAINQWQFTPTRLWDVPVETTMKVTVNFERGQ